jgi:hypothetical protein
MRHPQGAFQASAFRLQGVRPAPARADGIHPPGQPGSGHGPGPGPWKASGQGRASGKAGYPQRCAT